MVHLSGYAGVLGKILKFINVTYEQLPDDPSIRESSVQLNVQVMFGTINNDNGRSSHPMSWRGKVEQFLKEIGGGVRALDETKEVCNDRDS